MSESPRIISVDDHVVQPRDRGLRDPHRATGAGLRTLAPGRPTPTPASSRCRRRAVRPRTPGGQRGRGCRIAAQRSASD